jgi:microcystin-dependent protein
MNITQNTALFSLIGTFYGGDGMSTFALPDFRGRAAVGADNIGNFALGQQDGLENVTLLESEIPIHAHFVRGSSLTANVNSPSPSRMLARSRGGNAYQTATTQLATMGAQTIAIAGGSTQHNNLMPYLTFRFCIALQGIFPPRT